MQGRITTVFFDAGGTLLHPVPSVEELYCEVTAAMGVRLHPPLVRGVLERFWREHLEATALLDGFLPDSDERDRAFWRTHSRKIFDALPDIDGVPFEPWFERVLEVFATSRSWALFPEVDEVLGGLEGRGVRIGIVSNWSSSLLGICDDLGLTSRCDFVIASAQEGCRKPSRQIFLRALERAGAEPSGTVHVGDTPVDDVVGARRAGIRGVLVDRRRPSCPAEDRISDLREILALLDG